jgi:hypothetical protein
MLFGYRREEEEMGGACGTRGGERRGVVLVGTFGGTRTQGILGNNKMMILKLDVNKEDRGRGLNEFGTGWRPIAG